MKNNVIYARVAFCSKLDQERILNNQIKKLYRFAGYHKLSVSRVIKEQESSAGDKRPLIKKLLEGVKEGKVNGIICTGLDRLIKDPKDAVVINNLFKLGLEIITPRERYSQENINNPAWLIKLVTKQRYTEYYEDIIKRGLKAKGGK